MTFFTVEYNVKLIQIKYFKTDYLALHLFVCTLHCFYITYTVDSLKACYLSNVYVAFSRGKRCSNLYQL